MPDKPNVLLVVFDTARADAFEPYGAPAGASPAVRQLASRGVAAQRMRANACWTVPSHAAMFSGRVPRAAGLSRVPEGRPAGSRAALARLGPELLPERMRSAGYATAAVSTNLWITPTSGFDRGFDRFMTVDTRRQSEISGGSIRSRAAWLAEGLAARADDGAREAGRLLGGLEAIEPDGRPWFRFVNLVEAHSPYLPPRPYNPLGPLSRVRAAEEARQYLTMDAIWRACAGGLEVPAAAIERMRELYAAAIRSLDAWLADRLEELDAAGVLDETIVIVTSDHGENFGEEGLMGHAFSLDERLIRVPFVAAGPGLGALDGNYTLAGVPRLIAEATGIHTQPFPDLPGEADGLAVAQFDPPVGEEDERVVPALERWGVGAEAASRITSRIDTATDGRWKLVRTGSEESVLELEVDSAGVERPDAEPPPELLARLRAAIEESLGSDGGPARPAAGAGERADDEIDDAERARLEERMRLLGYM